MKTFLVVPDNILKAQVFLDNQTKLQTELQKALSQYNPTHQISVVKYLDTVLDRVWSNYSAEVFNLTTVVEQTYSIIKGLPNIYIGTATIPTGYTSFSIPVIGNVNTTYIRGIRYETPHVGIDFSGRHDLFELTVNDDPLITTDHVYQELLAKMHTYIAKKNTGKP